MYANLTSVMQHVRRVQGQHLQVEEVGEAAPRLAGCLQQGLALLGRWRCDADHLRPAMLRCCDLGLPALQAVAGHPHGCRGEQASEAQSARAAAPC